MSDGVHRVSLETYTRKRTQVAWPVAGGFVEGSPNSRMFLSTVLVIVVFTTLVSHRAEPRKSETSSVDPGTFKVGRCAPTRARFG